MKLDSIKKLICISSDIREYIVADLRGQIFGGVYEIRPEQVAERIIWHGVYMLNMLESNED